jgi:glycosyltransferase involved in cell wall biosynthesis
MNPILFIDTICPMPYDSHTLEIQALGGTEATVVRVAEKLSEKVQVIVVQHNRREISKVGNVVYSPWQAVICLIQPQHVKELVEEFGHSPMWIWFHDLISAPTFQYLKFMADHHVGAIVVSDFHAQQLLALRRLDPLLEVFPKVVRIYNPIDDDLQSDATPVDYNKLVFVSSPRKGLEYTLDAFEYVSQYMPELELHIANPGYLLNHPVFKHIEQMRNPKIKSLGALPHKHNIDQMRSALCLFALNHVMPETFGIALAESNAVGTPVLTHPMGGACEVLSSDPVQLINSHDLEAVVERLVQWREGKRPQVFANEAFRLSHIVKQWEDLLLH